MSHRKAFTLVELLVVVGIITVLIAIMLPAIIRAKENANRVKCSSNLRQIGIAIHMYMSDHKEYPRTRWSTAGPPAAFAYGKEGDPRWDVWAVQSFPNNVTAAMYLLVRQRYLTLGVFLCPSAAEERRAVRPGAEIEFQQWRDFTWAWPYSSLLSYSFACPYPIYDNDGTGTARDFSPPPKQPPDFAIAADANNAVVGVVEPPCPQRNGALADRRRGNSLNHRREGQNVLYLDGSVGWREDVFCGHNGDSIYHCDGSKGELMPPSFGPLSRYDSVLVPTAWDWSQRPIHPWRIPW